MKNTYVLKNGHRQDQKWPIVVSTRSKEFREWQDS